MSFIEFATELSNVLHNLTTLCIFTLQIQYIVYYFRQIYLSGPANIFAQDVAFNENYTRIKASRFIIQTHKILDANDDKDMMEKLRQVARDSPFNVTVFNPFFIYFDQVSITYHCCDLLS